MSAPSDTAGLKQRATEIVRRLRRHGHQAYWAGGAVRDLLLGRPPTDIDIATSARPDEVQALFPENVPMGKAFGVIQVLWEGQPFEVATFRAEADYTDGRHPDAIRFADARADALRRDFTINALFQDPLTGEILDFAGGRADLEARLIRAVGNPLERFSEDALRLLRAVRFASVLEFELCAETAEAIRQRAASILKVSPERIQQELTKLLTQSPRAGQGLLRLKEMGLLNIILPEVAQMQGQEQPPQFHPEGDVLTHTVLMLDRMETPSSTLAYAVLLHDVGKPATAHKTVEPGGSERWRFEGHAQAGADIAREILKRLRFSNDDIERITECIQRHMHFTEVPHMRKSTLRRLVGSPNFETELELHRLDCLCSHGGLEHYHLLKDFVEHMRNEPVLPRPWINGRDIMALGIPEGTAVGRWLNEAYTAQLDGSIKNREELLESLRLRIQSGQGGSPPANRLEPPLPT